MSQSVLMVGCGNMGGALLARWSELSDLHFTVLDPGLEMPPHGAGLVAHADQLESSAFDVIVAAVKPQLINTALPPAAAHLKPDGVVVSIAAGTLAETVSSACGGAPVVRLMPNMPAQIGRAVSGVFAQKAVTDSQRDLAHRLAAAVGSVIWLDDEDGVDRITASAGSGPGYVFDFARAYQAAVEAQGFSAEAARKLVVETMLGSLLLAADDNRTFEALRQSITSQGGTTAAGLAALNAEGRLDESLASALNAAYARAVELRL